MNITYDKSLRRHNISLTQRELHVFETLINVAANYSNIHENAFSLRCAGCTRWAANLLCDALTAAKVNAAGTAESSRVERQTEKEIVERVNRFAAELESGAWITLQDSNGNDTELKQSQPKLA